MRRGLVWWVIACLLCAPMALGDEEVSMLDVLPQATPAVSQAPPSAEATPEPQVDEATAGAARAELIDGMITLAEKLFTQAKGRAQRAHYSGDIYVCKNFTVHLFRENVAGYEMAAYPGVGLVIPNNLPRAESKPYAYGIFWQDVPADKGNPFYAAHTFTYDTELTAEENRALAMALMRGVQKGDFFQMSADYAYGVGAHSLVFTQDYDPDTNQVTWTDSNMNGTTRNGERYGYVQFDAKKDIGWFVDAFCQRTRGAVLYRLRDDIVAK